MAIKEVYEEARDIMLRRAEMYFKEAQQYEKESPHYEACLDFSTAYRNAASILSYAIEGNIECMRQFDTDPEAWE